MNMEYKEGWEETKARWTAFWNGEIIDRPIMLITTPSDDPPEIVIPDDYVYHWTDISHHIDYLEKRNLSTIYMGEAIPSVCPMSAWCAYYGGKTRFLRDTIWHEPMFSDWRDAPDWDTAWRDAGYENLLSMMKALCEQRSGRYFVGFPPILFGAPSDMVAAMRGTDRYLLDLLEYPDEVENAQTRMAKNYAKVYDEIWALIHSYGYEGYGNWWPIWSPEPLAVFQSDVSCMISETMFERFVAQHLETMTSHVVHAFYHLDGPDAIRHVDRICEMPNLDAIQWVPGAGTEPGALQWLDLFKRIQGHGKAVYFPLLQDELEPIIRQLDPSKIILGLSAATRDDANRLMENAARWTKEFWGL